MTEQDLDDLASTPHKGLPDRKADQAPHRWTVTMGQAHRCQPFATIQRVARCPCETALANRPAEPKDRKMWTLRLPLLLAVSLAAAVPAQSKPDYGDILSGIAQSLLTQELDRTTYVEAQRVNTASAYQSYLTKFPTGAYRANATQALARLGVPVRPLPIGNDSNSAAAIEASVGLGRTQRIQIQRQLTVIGYPTGYADGLWGTRTRSAIARWQSANKIAATGYLTAGQVNLIAKQAGPGVVTQPVTPVVGDDAVEERLLNLTYTERRDVQRSLTALGYNTFGVDGVFGANTRRALASWQHDEALRVSGYLTADQLRALRSQTGT